MEHLVEGHLGGYWIDSRDVEDIEEYCDECGDYDRVLFSWQEGHKMEALKETFSSIKLSRESIEWHCNNDFTKNDTVEIAFYSYEDDTIILGSLLEGNDISEKEYKELLKVIKDSKKQQISLILDVYKNIQKKEPVVPNKTLILKNKRTQE